MTGGAHHCERCADLEERVAWLEAELGLQRVATQDAALRDYFIARTPANIGRWGPAKMVAALYRAAGRVVSREQLLEAVPPADGGEDGRDARIVAVWVCHARLALGRSALESVWGKGYRLSPAGMALVASIIRGEPEQVAA